MAKDTYSKENCRNKALKYTTRSGFSKAASRYYNKALKEGWIDEICQHMEILKVNRTKEDCAGEASKYSKRYDFQKYSLASYLKAYKEGWIDEICSHMDVLKNYFSIDYCASEALKYSKRIDFQKQSPNVYLKALREGWLETICGHMLTMKNYYTIEDCMVSLEYTTRVEFKRKSPKQYRKACESGWIDEICSHMGSYKGGYNKDKPGYFYTVGLTTKIGEYVGFGITNYLDERLYSHKRNCDKEGFDFTLLSSVYYEDGGKAYKLERYLKDNLPIVNAGITGFKTEAILKSNQHLLTETMSKYSNLN
jgi:hypothetical protein